MAIKQTKTTPAASEMRWPFGKRNYIFMAVALVVIILGYVSLGMGSITLAPLLLVIGYCVLIPVALIIKDPSREANSQPTDESTVQ